MPHQGQLYQQVRQLSHELLPDDPGTSRLTSSLEALCRALNPHGTPQVCSQIDADLNQLPPAVQSAAYRIVAELVNNAVRHAQATQVQVHLGATPASSNCACRTTGAALGAARTRP